MGKVQSPARSGSIRSAPHYPQADSADADFMSCGAERILIINPSLRSGAERIFKNF